MVILLLLLLFLLSVILRTVQMDVRSWIIVTHKNNHVAHSVEEEENTGDDVISFSSSHTITTSANSTTNHDNDNPTTATKGAFTPYNNQVFSSQSPNDDSRTNSQDRPRGMVWLTSFPNSGTTYTISIVQHMTRTSTATNYGGNERDTKNNSLSVFYMDNHTTTTTTTYDGPYFRSPEQLGIFPYHNARIITKTHCAQRLPSFRPSSPATAANGLSFVAVLHQFIQSCATGSKYDNYTSVPTTYYDSPYGNDSGVNLDPARNESNNNNTQPLPLPLPPPPPPPKHLTGIIHLIRNPFTNILGRMNYQRNQWLRSSDPVDHQRAKFFPPHNRTGLYWWCQYKDRSKVPSHPANDDLDGDAFLWNNVVPHRNDTNGSSFYTEYLQPVPCHFEFFLYFYWHNMVHDMISNFDNYHNISHMTIYYEDYHRSDARQSIVEPLLYDMLHFTPEQIVNATVPPFIVSNQTDADVIAEMFTIAQQMAVKRLAQVMTTPATWALLERYFVNR